MPESASELPQGVVWDEPIARTAIEEVCGLIGHDPADVIRIIIEPNFAMVQVLDRESPDRDVTTHRHSIL